MRCSLVGGAVRRRTALKCPQRRRVVRRRGRVRARRAAGSRPEERRSSSSSPSRNGGSRGCRQVGWMVLYRLESSYGEVRYGGCRQQVPRLFSRNASPMTAMPAVGAVEQCPLRFGGQPPLGVVEGSASTAHEAEPRVLSDLEPQQAACPVRTSSSGGHRSRHVILSRAAEFSRFVLAGRSVTSGEPR